jgi:hypothetical protein
MTPVQYLQKLIKKAETHQKKEKFSDGLLKLSGDVVQAHQQPLASSVQQLGSTERAVNKPLTGSPLTSIKPPVQLSAPKPLDTTGSDQAHEASSNPIRGADVPKPPVRAAISKIPSVLKTARYTGITDVDGNQYINTEDVALLGKLGFDISAEEYCGLEKTSEALDVYSYVEKVAGVPKEVAKLINANQAFSGEYLKDMNYSVPEGYEVKGDLCCPSEKKEKRPSEKTAEEQSDQETPIVEKQSAERPGLWANIHAKIKRGEKAAEPGDKDYPDKEQWDKLSKEAMTLSYMKNVIRAARAAGLPILRSKAQLDSHLGENLAPILKKVPIVGEGLRKNFAGTAADVLDASGPMAFEGLPGLGENAKFIYMPKNFRAKAGVGYSPRAMLLHELGHAEHFAEDPMTWGKGLGRLGNSSVENASMRNLSETIANNNAINGMRNASVPEHLIETYKERAASPFYNTYAKTLEGVVASPTGHMRLPQRIGHSANQTVTAIGKKLLSRISGKTVQPAAPAPFAALPKIPHTPPAMTGKRDMFAPLTEYPTYTHPTTQEFNVPYSV